MKSAKTLDHIVKVRNLTNADVHNFIIKFTKFLQMMQIIFIPASFVSVQIVPVALVVFIRFCVIAHMCFHLLQFLLLSLSLSLLLLSHKSPCFFPFLFLKNRHPYVWYGKSNFSHILSSSLSTSVRDRLCLVSVLVLD